MLARSDLVSPCRLRLKPTSSGRSTRATPSSVRMRIVGCMVCESSPRGPRTVTRLVSSTCTSTPSGISTGCLPILLMSSSSLLRSLASSPDVGEHFAAHAPARRVLVRHQAVGRRDDRDAEPALDTRELVVATVDPPPGLRDPPGSGDRAAAAHAVLQPDPERLVHAFAFARVPADVALGL